jgi:prolyl-tRNA editing enzyme YbaK/EbsC (Cys-tRNA(Pro) deacylase)
MACAPDLADTAAFCEAYGIPLDRSANTIVVSSRRPEGHHVACVVLATDRLDVNGEVRRRLDVKKASFAPAEETVRLTGMMIGGVTPFALPKELPIWIDAGVMALDWVILGAGSRSAKVRIDPELLTALANVTVIDRLAKPTAPGDDGPVNSAAQKEEVADDRDQGE